MNVRQTHALGLVILLVVAACGPAGPTSTPLETVPRTDAPVAPSPAPRLGSRDLVGSGGASIGTFAAVRESDEQTRLTVSLRAEDARAWGIYDQAACAPPALDHDAPFQFADIEGGSRSELVETPAYLGFPTNMVVLVFGADGGSIAGCADLGPPAIALASPGPTERCDASGSPSAGPSAGPDAVLGIAFSKDALSNSDIYLMNDDGTGVQRLTNALGVDMKPTWSPDGRQIAFRTSRDGQDEIYVMASDGSCERNITHDPRDDRSPAWSPSGCEIAFDHFFVDRYQDVATISVGGGSPRRITTRSGEYPSWSPDGRQIAFASARDGDYDIYVINADGSDEHQVVDLAGYQFYPVWSPDGQWIAYESGPSTIEGLQIHVMRVDGTDDRAITNDTATNRFPAWAPDGRLAWSASGTIVVAASLDATPAAVGPGQFPAWRPTTVSGGSAC